MIQITLNSATSDIEYYMMYLKCTNSDNFVEYRNVLQDEQVHFQLFENTSKC